MKLKVLVAAVAILFAPVLLASGLPPPVPASGTYLGMWAGPELGPDAESAIEVREGPAPGGVNHRLALHLHYYGWTKIAALLNNGAFQPDVGLQGDISHGRVPVISWECDSSMSNSDHEIASGNTSQDAIITATARALAQYPGPVLLRWFWEFNDLSNTNRQVCRGDTGGKPTQAIYDDFIGAWRRIRQLFQNAGATNVSFLWNPGHYNADGNGDDPHGFYPGNDYVDWIGLDSYQSDTSDSFATDLSPFYADFTQPQYAGKPLMVGENGSQNWVQHNQEFQHSYLQGLLADLQSNMFPRLKAYCYFDSVGNRGSWVLDDNNGQGNGGLAAFEAMAASAVFSPPAVTLVANAEGDNSMIAPNSWVEIKGLNLAINTRMWQISDFTDNQMPTQLDKVSATVSGKSAYVYYISPTQINILTPPDAISGNVQVVVTNNYAATASFTAQAQTLSPSLFVFNGGPYVAARHSDYSLLGPTSLYPGSTTPAKPNDIVLLYGNGFGPTSTPVVSGSITQGGMLPVLPIVKIGGISASVQYAGLVSAGEYQFNVVVPGNTPDGDQTVTVSYGGQNTQSGVLLAVQR